MPGPVLRLSAPAFRPPPRRVLPLGSVGIDRVLAFDGIPSAQAVGAPVLSSHLTLSPGSIVSTEAIGSLVLTSHLTISPSSIGTGESVSGFVLTFGQTILPSSIGSAESVSSPYLVYSQFISPSGIASSGVMGSPTFSFGSLLPSGIPSGEALGTPGLVFDQTISPTSISSDESFGTVLFPSLQEIVVGAIDTAESLGTPDIFFTNLFLPLSIDSHELVSDPDLIRSIEILPVGIGSTGSFGTCFIGIVISPSSINVSEPSVGSHIVFTELIVYSNNWPERSRWLLYLAYSAMIGPGAGPKPPTAAALDLAGNVSLDLVFNRPGSCKFKLPLEDEASRLVVPKQTCILAVRDGIVRWSGPVTTVDHDLDANETNVGAEGWMSTLDGRRLRQILHRAAETDPERVAALFAAIAVQVDSHGNPIPLLMTYGGHTGLPRNVGPHNYEVGNVLGSLVNGLSDIENGFDIQVSPTTRIMTTHRSLIRGGIYGYGVDRPGALFSYGVGNDNTSKFRETNDASRIANIINALGPEGTRPQTTDDPDSIATFGAYEDDFSMTDQGINEQELRFGAAAEVFYRRLPQVIYTLTPFPWHENGNVPRLYDDFELGDIGRIAAKRAWKTIPAGLSAGQTQPARFYGANVTIRPNGDEEISQLYLAPQ